jgi:hypothetical protein
MQGWQWAQSKRVPWRFGRPGLPCRGAGSGGRAEKTRSLRMRTAIWVGYAGQVEGQLGGVGSGK